MIRSLARLAAAALVLAATAAFAIGVVIEHHSEATEHAAERPPAATGPAAPGTAAGQGDTDADDGQDQDADHGGGTDADSGHEGSPAAEAAERSELVFGLNLESPALVAAAVVVSVLLAIAILTIATPWLAALTAAVMLAFTVLDIRELVHQFGQSHTELAAIAIVAALLHLLATVTAAHVARTGHAHRGRTTATPT
ncbi:MAG TPA: hypothetical protein VFX16_18050 [Pseudonocardiaceae bacterium]|nr:hypothetical protein [Pseudonocardiaceae bacterium]